MKIISTTEARENLGKYLDDLNVNENHFFVVGRREEPEAVIVKFPSLYKSYLTDITNVNSYSTSFDFLKDEPEEYGVSDAIAKYN